MQNDLERLAVPAPRVPIHNEGLGQSAKVKAESALLSDIEKDTALPTYSEAIS